MRSHHILPKLMLLGVGSGIAAYMFGKRHREEAGVVEEDPEDRFDLTDQNSDLPLDREPASIPDSYDYDPADPVQSIDEVNELHTEELRFDAMSAADAQAAGDINLIESSLDQDAMDLDPPAVRTLDDIEEGARDVGDLYGVHTPMAEDRQHLDGDASFAEGQNWIEALETDAVEGGPVAEVGVEDVVDDDEIFAAPHSSDTQDTPVADRGSGGPAGI